MSQLRKHNVQRSSFRGLGTFRVDSELDHSVCKIILGISEETNEHVLKLHPKLTILDDSRSVHTVSPVETRKPR
jgi:hypothetical protein